MWDQTKMTLRAFARRIAAASGSTGANVPLFVRMAVVVAIGAVVVQQLNAATPMLVFAGPGDATAFVMDQLHDLSHASVRLMSLGNDVIAFLGL